MELHLGVVVVVVQAEGLVGGQHVEQLPLPLVHEQAVVFLQLLGAPHQCDVDVFDCSVEAQATRQRSGIPYSPIAIGWLVGWENLLESFWVNHENSLMHCF